MSPFDVLGHLVDGEETDWSVASLQDEFAMLRAANLQELTDRPVPAS